MIVFENVSKTVFVGKTRRTALSSIDLVIPSDRRVALLGGTEEDRRLVINCIGGLVLPTSGRIVRKARVSFPVGSLAGFLPELSVRLNVAHVARLYDMDVNSILSFVEGAAELGPKFDDPYRELPKLQRLRLSLVIGFGIPFDVYLLMADINRVARPVRDIAYTLFQERARTSGMIISTRDPAFASEYCDMALLLHEGALHPFDRVEDAVGQFEKVRMAAAFEHA